jgi:hypothetical protein
MNSQDLHNLQEAYLDVYELMERNEEPYIIDVKKSKRNPQKVEQQKTTHRKVEQNPSFFGGKTFGSLTGKMSKSPRNQKEETDLYDIILSHLLDEGYAETQEQAEVIMVNMSEDWRESIFENVSSGKGRVTRYVQSRPTGPVTNRELDTSRQRRMDAENDRIKKIGDEAHAAATSKGLSFGEAEFRRKRAELRARKNS